MKKIDSHDPDLMIFRSGGGCLILFGLPFMISGFFTMIVPFLKTQGDVGWPISLFGFVFFAVGLCISFGRSGIVIDKKMKSVTSWWGLIFPIQSKLHELYNFKNVAITKEIRRSKNSTYTVYPVRMTGEDTLSFGENTSYETSRKLAEEIAKFLLLPLSDASSGTEIIRDPDKLDESVRDKILRTGEVKEIPPTPKNSKLLYDREGDEIRLEIPPVGWHPLFYIPIFIAGVFSCILYFVFLRQVFFEVDTPTFFKVFLGIFVIAPFGLVFGAIYRFASKRTMVHVSPKTLQVTEAWTFGKQVKEIPVKEMEELRIISALANANVKDTLDAASSSPNKNDTKDIQNVVSFFGSSAILARSDSVTIQFGSGLSSEEIQWVHAVIENTIAM